MTNDYSDMSDEELTALRQQIDRELASRTKKPVKPAPPTKPPVKTPKVPAPPPNADRNAPQGLDLHRAYRVLIGAVLEQERLQPELDNLLEQMRDNKPANLAGVNGIIGVLANYRDKPDLKRQLAQCREYCQTNGIEVTRELSFTDKGSYIPPLIDNLLQGQIGVIVATRGWVTGYSLREGVAFVRQLEQAGIHLEIIDTEDQDKPGSRE